MTPKQNKTLLTTLTLVIMASMATNLAQATESKENKAKELALFSQAKISLTDAIKAAEQKTGGKAVKADIHDEASAVQFEIGILKDSKLHEVMVDGKTGDKASRCSICVCGFLSMIVRTLTPLNNCP